MSRSFRRTVLSKEPLRCDTAPLDLLFRGELARTSSVFVSLLEAGSCPWQQAASPPCAGRVTLQVLQVDLSACTQPASVADQHLFCTDQALCSSLALLHSQPIRLSLRQGPWKQMAWVVALFQVSLLGGWQQQLTVGCT